MENRRDFFKAAGLFFAGLAANKLNAMVPKKQEDKDELMVSETITVHHEGVEYHPVVVKKTTTVETRTYESGSLERMRITSSGNVGIGAYNDQPKSVLSMRQYKEPKLRKLK